MGCRLASTHTSEDASAKGQEESKENLSSIPFNIP